MNESNAEDFNELLDVTWEIYPKPLSAQAKRMYWEALRRFSYAEVQGAISRHIQNPDAGQFAPKPADIIRMITGSTQTASATAWTKALRAIKSVGPYRSVVFDDPIIHAAITDMGGWISFCGITEQEEPFIAKDFERRYSGYALRDKVNYPKLLKGLSDMSNDGQIFERGEAIPQITIFGDKEKARLVYKGGGEQKANMAHVALALPKKTA